MKKIIFTLLSLSFLVATSCEKEEESRTYEPLPNEGY